MALGTSERVVVLFRVCVVFVVVLHVVVLEDGGRGGEMEREGNGG